MAGLQTTDITQLQASTTCDSSSLQPNVLAKTLPIVFVNQTVVTVNHKFGRLVFFNVYDQTNNVLTEGVSYTAKADVNDPSNTIIFTFPAAKSGTIVIQ